MYEVRGRGCPSEAELRGLVAARLGSDPFVDEAPRTVVVRSRTTAQGAFEIEVTTSAEGPGPLPSKSFRGTEGQCAELVQRAALAIALLAEDDPAPTPSPPAKQSAAPIPVPTPAASAPAPPPARAAEPAPPAPNEPARTFAVGVEAFAHAGSAATTPGPGLGLVFFGRRSLFTFGVAARFLVPTSKTFDAGRVTTTTLGAGPFVCVGGARADVCVPIVVGATLGEGGAVAEARSDTSPFVSVGLRPELHAIPLGRAELSIFVEGYVAPASTSFVFRDGTAFTTAPAGALLGVAGKLGIF